MFVSSYSTYIHSATADRATKARLSTSNETASFSSKLSKLSKVETQNSSNLPIDYVQSNKSFSNKLEIKRQEQSLKNPEAQESVKPKEVMKGVMSYKLLENAKKVYEDSLKPFSPYKMPHHTQNQTPKINENLPKEVQELKENNMRHIMVNTYLSNDNYYKITA